MRKMILLVLVFGLCSSASFAQRKEAAAVLRKKILQQTAASPQKRIPIRNALAEEFLAPSLEKAIQIPYTLSGATDELKSAVEEALNGAVALDKNNFSTLLTPEEAQRNSRYKSVSEVILKSRSSQLVPSLEKITRQPKIVVTPQFEFLNYIAPESRIVMVGESHFEHLYKKPVLTILEELRRAGKDVYLASEFAAADLPDGKTHYTSTELSAVAVHRYYAPVLRFARDNGIKVIPLESAEMIDVSKEMKGQLSPEEQDEKKRYFETFVMMGKRNKLWVARIEKVLEENPHAVIVINCGESHSEYFSAYGPSLPTLLRKYKMTNIVTFGGKYGKNFSGNKVREWHRTEVINDSPWARLYYVMPMPIDLAHLMGADLFVHLPEKGTGEYLMMRGQMQKEGFVEDERSRKWEYLPSPKMILLSEEDIFNRVQNWDD